MSKLITYKNGIKREIYTSKVKRIPIEGKEDKFAIGNFIKINEFTELNGKNKIQKNIFFTDEVPKGEYLINEIITFVEPANKLPLKQKIKPSFEPDAIYERPILGLGATAVAGTYAYQTVLLGSIYGALFGAFGLLFAPFILSYTLPLATKTLTFLNKLGKSYENNEPFLSYKQEELQKNVTSYLNIIEKSQASSTQNTQLSSVATN